jgi:DUF1680 family protein
LGFRTQEHCTVYNMMRLSEFLLRWTDDLGYADYWERNLWNGILAQQHPDTGMISYFLPMYQGAEKVWGTPTDDFWCCHGSLVQAHTIYANHVWYEDPGGLTLTQYIPSQANWEHSRTQVSLRLENDPQLKQNHRPDSLAYQLQVEAAQPVEFSLRIRIPGWVSGTPEVRVNGEAQQVQAGEKGEMVLRRVWNMDSVHLTFPKKLSVVPLPDEPDTCAFMDGPVVLAGLNPGAVPTAERTKQTGSYNAKPNYAIDGITISGDRNHPETILIPDNEREWGIWRGDFRTRNQAQNFRLIPLYEVRDEVFSIYFPIRKD